MARKATVDPTFEKRRKIVGVMGDGDEEHAALAEGVGTVIARMGCHLLNGAGKGAMEASSRAFQRSEPKGLVIGIVRAAEECPASHTGRRDYKPRVLNRYVDVPVFTHLHLSGPHGEEQLSRNHINVLTADCLGRPTRRKRNKIRT
jgi:hypothetical protein